MKRYLNRHPHPCRSVNAGSCRSRPTLRGRGHREVVLHVIDAAPSKNLKVLGDKQGYGGRDQAEQALKGLSCKALDGQGTTDPIPPLWGRSDDVGAEGGGVVGVGGVALKNPAKSSNPPHPYRHATCTELRSRKFAAESPLPAGERADF